jgi:IclR family transcriptional regulator, pca regulon regulatory protein
MPGTFPTTLRRSSPSRRPSAADAARDEATQDPSEDFADDRDFVAALARGLAVLLAFSHKRRRLTIAEVSHRTGASRAAVRRSLHTLVRLGYAGHDLDGRFYLRPKVLAFGEAYLSATPIALLAQPILDRLSDALGESASLAIGDGDEIVYLARSVSSRILSTTLNVGGRMPAYCTSIGRVLLAELPSDALDAYLARVTLHAFTERTVTSPDALRQLLQQAARHGYAIADQQMEPGIATIAVPVRSGAKEAVGGINVLIRSARIPVRSMVARFVPSLKDAARELGRMLPQER